MPVGYRVTLAQSAKKELEHLRNPLQKRVASALQALSLNPRARGCRKLSGHEAKYRVRVGDYRVIYEIDDVRSTVWVSHIRHRSEAYDWHD